jgi:hypothetical protein
MDAWEMTFIRAYLSLVGIVGRRAAQRAAIVAADTEHHEIHPWRF